MRTKFIKRTAFVLIVLMLASCLSSLLFACNTKDNGEQDESKAEEPIYIMVFYTGSKDSSVSQIEPIKSEAGKPITKPGDPSYTGYRFGGWYRDYNVWQMEYTDFSVMPKENVVLYAKWDEVGGEEKVAYEKKLDENSKEGHLYIHYKRFVNTPEEYEQYDMWVWPKAMTGVAFDWVRDDTGKVVVDEFGGATCDVDLTAYYDNAGNAGDKITTFLKTITSKASQYVEGDIFNRDNYTDIYIGFLVVLKSSKELSVDEGGMWISDGGNQFIPKASETGKAFSDKLRENGSMHIFATQEHVYDFAYSVTDLKEMVDPYKDDDGTNVSISNLDSSSIYPVQKTAEGINGVGYQIMVASFADSDGDGYGDIQGIIDNLDYLDNLNIDVLWLTPIQLSDSYHGYDIIDYKEVDPKFGTLEIYKELLQKAEQKGMKVIMDLVLNHTSINNVWFQKSAQLDPEYRSYYQWKNNDVNSDLSDSWHKYGEHCYSYYGKFSTGMPELNYDYQGTRDAIVDVANYWLDIGVDGFRIDAVKHIYMADEVTPNKDDIIINDYDSATKTDYSSNVTKNLNFFREFNARIKEKHPDAYIVGENFDGHAYNVAPYYEGLDSMLNFYAYFNFAQICDNQAASPNALAGGNSSECKYETGVNTYKLKTDKWNFAGTSATYDAYRQGDAIDGLFTSNHDVLRLMNNVISSAPNQAPQKVTSANATTALGRSKAVIATMMTLPGVSFIYYGDELGMTSNFASGESKTSPHIDRRYRQPFKWTTADYDDGGSKYITHYSISGDATYYVEWDDYNETLKGVNEQDSDNTSMLNFVRKWTNVKSNDDVIKYGSYGYIQTDDKVFAYTLTYDGTTYYCYHNFSGGTVSGYKRGGGSMLYSDSGVSENNLPAYSSVIFK